MDMTTAHILDSLGWAIIHSFWQGAIAALAVFTFRAMTKDSQAGLRCGFELIALGLCFTAFLVTFSGHFFSPATAEPILPSLANILTSPAAIDPVLAGAAEPLAISGPSVTQYTPILGIFWCFGFILLATRYSVGFAMTHRLRTRGLSPAPSQWQNRFETLVLNSGIFRGVSLHISDRVSGPITLGFFKPVVLVPASFFTGLPGEQIEAILLHEIAHIRRNDYVINLVQTAIKTVLFYHPAIHYICRTIDEDREKACDDFAVLYTKDPTSLAKGLATLRLTLSPPGFAMAASRTRNPLLRRLTRLTAPEENRRRRPGQSWGQIIATMVALVVAAGIYSGTQVEFANAHPPETDAIPVKDKLHVSADKKNYSFGTVWHNGREIAIKIASDGSRWVYFSNSWFNIDKNPKILDGVPDKPLAPQMPRPENFNAYVKFEKAVNQYRASLDYYIAALEINACQDCTKSKLHWAKKQRERVSKPSPNFDQDLLWKETSSKNISPPHPTPSPKPAPKPTPKPNPKPAPYPQPQAQPQPIQQAQPISMPAPAPLPIVKTVELAGKANRKENKFYLNGELYDADSWEEETDDRIERIEVIFENKMDSVEGEFERALEKFEIAAENFAYNPEGQKDYFKRAQKDFASAVIAANKTRATLQSEFDRDIRETVDQQVRIHTSHIQKTVNVATHKALKQARIAADKVHKTHVKNYQKSDETNHRTHNVVAEEKVPTYSDYGQVMLAQLGNDGVIPHGTESVNIEYKSGDMYVNGSIVNKDTADNYCSINSAFNIEKSDNMRIEVKPERLTITDYNY